MCVYRYTYTSTHTHIQTQIHVHVSKYVCMCIHASSYIYTQMKRNSYAHLIQLHIDIHPVIDRHMGEDIDMYMDVGLGTYRCTCTYTHTHALSFTFTRTRESVVTCSGAAALGTEESPPYREISQVPLWTMSNVNGETMPARQPTEPWSKFVKQDCMRSLGFTFGTHFCCRGNLGRRQFLDLPTFCPWRRTHASKPVWKSYFADTVECVIL